MGYPALHCVQDAKIEIRATLKAKSKDGSGDLDLFTFLQLPDSDGCYHDGFDFVSNVVDGDKDINEWDDEENMVHVTEEILVAYVPDGALKKIFVRQPDHNYNREEYWIRVIDSKTGWERLHSHGKCTINGQWHVKLEIHDNIKIIPC